MKVGEARALKAEGLSTKSGLQLSVLVPTYMEAENLPELVERIKAALNGVEFEVIVIDDNSPDGTAKVVKELDERLGNLRVVERLGKMGLGSAVRDGLRVAGAPWIAVMDADLQHPPELLSRMLEKAWEGYDIVVASRYVKDSGIERWGFLRRVISRGAISLAHFLLPKTRMVQDPVSGFFLFNRMAVDEARLNTIGYKILLEILVKGRYSRVSEVPYVFRSRRRSRSKLGLREILRYALLLMKLRLGR